MDMPLDLSKLPAAPWIDGGPDNFGDGWVHCLMAGEDLIATVQHAENRPECEEAKAIVGFFVLARKAFDARQRRGWWSCPRTFDEHGRVIGWDVWGFVGGRTTLLTKHDGTTFSGPDSDSPIIEADVWHKANVDSSQSPSCQ